MYRTQFIGLFIMSMQKKFVFLDITNITNKYNNCVFLYSLIMLQENNTKRLVTA